MRAIMVMYDSLNRNFLQPYGCDWTKTPNFERLARKCVTFENSYVGSLPCMPARRELHTGRCNFLHRSWGPLEPFDDSMPEILKNNGIYTHLVSDHMHYWEDGGATYHHRYNSWECQRGQEGDRWKARLPIGKPPETAFDKSRPPLNRTALNQYFDEVNRMYQDTTEKMPQSQTFKNGMEFLENNHQADNWFLQIETFDPHEPFYSTEEFKKLYPHEYSGKRADWPPYYPVQEDQNTIDHTRYEYAALLSMCDRNLGRVLDFMDEHDMWKDTMLIVNTDHGFLLGEHDWWGKSIMPVYDELAKTPLFIWNPKVPVSGERRKSLVQTIDVAPTLLEFFDQEIPKDMEGKPLSGVIRDDAPVRDYAVYGYHGGSLNITDGHYTYMRCPIDAHNEPLFEYTLMPTHMGSRFGPKEFDGVELVPPFSFTKDCKLLKTKPSEMSMNHYQFGNKLFCIETDPEQLKEIDDIDREMAFISLIADYLRKVDAPKEQFKRLGIPESGEITREMLLEQRNKRKENFEPDVLTDYEWEASAKKLYSIMVQVMARNSTQVKEGFSAFAQQASPEKKVSKQTVLSFIEKLVPPEMLEMLKYGLAFSERSS